MGLSPNRRPVTTIHDYNLKDGGGGGGGEGVVFTRTSMTSHFYTGLDGKNVVNISKVARKDGRNYQVIKPVMTWLIYYWQKLPAQILLSYKLARTPPRSSWKDK